MDKTDEWSRVAQRMNASTSQAPASSAAIRRPAGPGSPAAAQTHVKSTGLNIIYIYVHTYVGIKVDLDGMELDRGDPRPATPHVRPELGWETKTGPTLIDPGLPGEWLSRCPGLLQTWMATRCFGGMLTGYLAGVQKKQEGTRIDEEGCRWPAGTCLRWRGSLTGWVYRCAATYALPDWRR